MRLKLLHRHDSVMLYVFITTRQQNQHYPSDLVIFIHFVTIGSVPLKYYGNRQPSSCLREGR